VIAHLVLFKLKTGVAADDPRLGAVVGAMDTLPRLIPQIRGWEHGPNRTPDAQACDYGLRALFDDESALHAYFDHPAHLPVLRQWEELADLVFCDFDLP
jgi:hypothetical protein